MNGKERLAILADALEYNAEDPSGMKFNLHNWVDASDWSGLPGAWYPKIEDRGRDCGTTGCAVGLACLLPELKAEGLSATYAAHLGAMMPTFNGYRGFDAVQDFFGIDSLTATNLFHWNNYSETKGADAEKMVAQRIRAFVADPLHYMPIGWYGQGTEPDGTVL